MKKIIFLSISASMLGSASFLALDLGFVQLSLFRLGILIVLVYMLLTILLKNNKIHLNKSSENSFSIKTLIIWLIYSIFSLAWVEDYSGWFNAIFFISLGLATTIILSVFLRSRYDILKLFRVIIPIIIFHNLIGWYEVLTGNYLFLSVDRIDQYSRLSLPVSNFGNTNDFAVFLMFAVFIIYICLVNSTFLLSKIIYVFVFISSIGLILYTNSRGVLLGLLLGFLVLLFHSLQKKWTRRIALTFLFCLLLITLLNPNDFFQSLDNALTFNIFSQSETDLIRKNLILNGLYFLQATFGFGTGAGNIGYWIANHGIYYTAGIKTMHNWWLEILVGYGVLFFILYITFYSKLILSMKKKFKLSKNKEDTSISLGIMSIMIGYIIASVSSSSNFNADWLWTFWAIVISYQGMKIKKEFLNSK